MVNFIRKYWGGILAALVAGVFFWQRKEINSLSEKVVTADADKKDAVLTEKQDEVVKQIEAVKTQADAEKKQTLSQSDMESYLKKL